MNRDARNSIYLWLGALLTFAVVSGLIKFAPHLRADRCEIDGETVELNGVLVLGSGGPFHSSPPQFFATGKSDITSFDEVIGQIDNEHIYAVRFAKEFSTSAEFRELAALGEADVYGLWSGQTGLTPEDCYYLRDQIFSEGKLLQISGFNGLRVLEPSKFRSSPEPPQTTQPSPPNSADRR